VTSQGSSGNGVESINWIVIVLIPVMLSVLLVVLFYALSSLWILAFIIIAVMSLGSVVLVTWPLFEILNLQVNKICKSDMLTDYGGLGLSVLTAAVLGIVWIATGYWLVLDLLAVCTIIAILSHIRLPSLTLGISLLCIMLVYDVVWTFVSPLLFGQSVMEHVAKQVSEGWVALPVVISVPHVWSNGSSLLGLGDIIIPGLYLVFLVRWDTHNRDRLFEGTARVGYLGYSVGFILTFIILVLSDRGQPALLYIVPCILITSLSYSYIKNELTGLRSYSFDSPIIADDAATQIL